MTTTARCEDKGWKIVYDGTIDPPPDARWFRPPPDAGRPEGGRGSAWFIDTPVGPGVLRQYRRGGLAAKASEQSYLYTGDSEVRSIAEFTLTQTLDEWGLPVPAPVAAGYHRSGLTYQAALITRRLPNTRSLATALHEGSIPTTVWEDVGRTLRRFQERGVYHADFNAHNILLDDTQTVYFIDFDRGRLRSGDTWWHRNIDRLERSLNKLELMDAQGFAALKAAHSRN